MDSRNAQPSDASSSNSGTVDTSTIAGTDGSGTSSTTGNATPGSTWEHWSFWLPIAAADHRRLYDFATSLGFADGSDWCELRRPDGARVDFGPAPAAGAKQTWETEYGIRVTHRNRPTRYLDADNARDAIAVAAALDSMGSAKCEPVTRLRTPWQPLTEKDETK